MFPTRSIGNFRLAAGDPASDKTDMEESWLRDRVEARLKALNKRPIPAATSVGLGRDYIADILAGRKRSVTAEKLIKLAEALECPPGFLSDPDYDGMEGDNVSGPTVRAPRPATQEAGRPVDLAEIRAFLKERRPPEPAAPTINRLKPATRALPVVGEVAAGIWKEALALQHYEVTEWLPVEVQGYELATLRVFKVVGNSMNEYYPHGRYVVVAPTAEAGLNEGDHVIVERMKLDVVEVTIKELVYDEEGRIALWPRSTDPAFQTPIHLTGGDEADQTAPLITGVVIADYGKRDRRSGFTAPTRGAR